MTEPSQPPSHEPASAPWERLPEKGAPAAEQLPELNASVHHVLQRTELWMWLLAVGLFFWGVWITLAAIVGWTGKRGISLLQVSPPPKLWPVLLLGGLSCLAGAVVLGRCATALRAFCRNESPRELEQLFRFQFRFWQVGVFGALMLLSATALVIAVGLVVKLGL